MTFDSTPAIIAPAGLHLRWMIRRDMPEVLAIDRAGRPDGSWPEEDYLRVLRQKNVIGMIAEDTNTDRIVGAMAYELNIGHIRLLRLTVDPACRRRGVGTAMVEKLKGKLSPLRRHKIATTTPDCGDLAGARFLGSMGFVATRVERDGYGPGMDAIAMVYRCEWEDGR